MATVTDRSLGDRVRPVVAEPARLLLRLLAARATRRTIVPSGHRSKRVIERMGGGLVELVPVAWAQRVGARLATALEPLDVTADDSRWSFAELGATFRLTAVLPARAPWPPLGGVRVSADFGIELVDAIARTQPDLVVELGSGSSTLILAYAVEQHGGRVVSFDHHAGFAAASRALLEAHGFGPPRVEVRLAPLHDVTIGDQTWPWYDIGDPDEIGPIDVLVVDGPPGTLHPLIRYPALPVLHDAIRPGGIVLVDDGGRPDEREMVRRWQLERPEWTVEPLRVQAGGFRLRKPGEGPNSR